MPQAGLDLGDLPTWLQAGATILALAIAVGAPLQAARAARRRQEVGAIMALDHAFHLINHYVREADASASLVDSRIFDHRHLEYALEDLRNIDRGALRKVVARRLFDCRTLLLNASFCIRQQEVSASPDADFAALAELRDRLADRLRELCQAAGHKPPASIRDFLGIR